MPVALTLARPCRHTAMRMSWLGNLRQRRCPARMGLVCALAAWLGLTAAVLTAQVTSGPTIDRDALVLDKLTVDGERVEDYAPPAASLAGKSGISLDQNPQSIAIVPEGLLADWRPLKLEEALAGVAGVATGGYYDDWDYLRIRGFDVTPNDTYVDGLRSGAGWVAMNIETFGLERIEVLKGPAALYGAGSVGGLVNLVSKRPHDAAFAELEISAGSYDFLEATLDFNRPLDAGKNVLFRVVAIARDRNSHIDYVGSRRVHLAPSLTWRLAPDTTLTVLGSYHENEGRLAWPLPAEGTVLPNPNGRIPLDLYSGEPDTNGTVERTKKTGVELTHAFSDRITLTQSVRYEDYYNFGDRFMYPGYLSDDRRTLYRYWWTWDETADALVADTRLRVQAGREGFRHDLTTGFDYYRRTHHGDFSYNWTDAVPLDLFAPVYGVELPPAADAYGSDERTRLTGLYAQDHIALARNVTLTFGGRYDFSKVDGDHDQAFTGRAGATWEFRPGLTAYASYSEAFNVQAGTTLDGSPLKPETGDNLEAGLRGRMFEDRLHATVSLYEINRRDLATADLANPGYYLTTGGQRSRGVELDARYTPVKGWEILGAYAYTDTAITADNSLPVGARIAGVPLHTFNAWTKYSLQRGSLRGLGFGLGANHTSTQDGDRTYTAPFQLRGYTVWRAALYYSRGPFRAQLNVSNFFDKEHFVGAYDPLYVGVGAPRTARLTFGWKF
jgi:iron complex outermembrane receptor protein